MPIFDLPLSELRQYKPARTDQGDFDAFWDGTLAEARSHPLNARFEPADFDLKTVETFDVTFAGYGGQDIKGWLLLPRHREEPLACVVEYIGYNGGRSIPYNWLPWSAAGYAHLVMDTRGQGTGWVAGDTIDHAPAGTSPHYAGWMTQGILDKDTYYYRRLFTDAARAVEAARSHPAVDSERVAITGVSQGGGITLAVSGLVPDVPVVMPDVPFLCHYRRATEIVDTMPYYEIVHYCKKHRDKIETVFNTLSYFDGMNFAARARGKALFSVGLMDDICPPSTVFAAFNHYGGADKQVKVYEFNNHEGGEQAQVWEKIKFLNSVWG